ncbi:hypothetical protein CMI40_02150 [Candidatus Pacearchaeota archaeon]|jgi:ribosomal protein L22|nr:hypothetical protein [Candidatus Pacearchaeota archaeon]|tara:strand:- start:9401 stop:10054 length:654 start_codon:yes stop_codon:yes gene_type:complete
MTEKDYNPEKRNEKAMKKQNIANAPKKIVDVPKVKEEDKKIVETLKEEKTKSSKENLEKTDKKEEIETKKKETPKIKRTQAIVNGTNLPISTKHSTAICSFIKRKKIEKAISDLEQVIVKKKAVPMKGEIPHKKGKGMMSGRYPKKAAEHFIKLLKSLLANINSNELNNPIITDAIANIGSRPYSKFGAVRKKRSHIKIIAKENKSKEKKNGRKKSS